MSAFPTTAAGTVAIGFAVLQALVFVLHERQPRRWQWCGTVSSVSTDAWRCLLGSGGLFWRG